MNVYCLRNPSTSQVVQKLIRPGNIDIPPVVLKNALSTSWRRYFGPSPKHTAFLDSS